MGPAELVLRIDFYITPRGVVFGEFTPHPGGGSGYSNHALSHLDGLMAKHSIEMPTETR